MLKKILDLIPAIIILIALGCAYYLLLFNNYFHASIASIMDASTQMGVKPHLILLTFLPVYISFVIFGACLCGFQLGLILKKQLTLLLRNKH